MPRGQQRRWPHIATLEGVKGEEYYLFGQGPTPAYNVNLVFTRNIVGSMDQCPSGFELVGTPSSRRTTSNAHEMALAIMFESGWQSMSVSPESMKDNPAKGFLKDMPSAWDDIHFVDGYPGEFAVLARRKGKDWWLAGINAGTPREVVVPLGFLRPGSYKTRLYHDAPTSKTSAVKALPGEAVRTRIAVDDLTVDTASPLKVFMPTNGGFGVRFEGSVKEMQPRCDRNPLENVRGACIHDRPDGAKANGWQDSRDSQQLPLRSFLTANHHSFTSASPTPAP
jgi:hypothetical protein